MTDKCLVEDCPHEAQTRGVCARHYRKALRGRQIGVRLRDAIPSAESGRRGGLVGGKARVAKGFAVTSRKADK